MVGSDAADDDDATMESVVLAFAKVDVEYEPQ